MPEEWFSKDYKERFKKCGVPGDLEFMSKPQIAFDLLEKNIYQDLFPARWIGCDAEFGCNHEFLDNISNAYYFADQKSDTKVWMKKPEVNIPPYKGRGPYPKKMKASEKPISLKKLIETHSLPWENVILVKDPKDLSLQKLFEFE